MFLQIGKPPRRKRDGMDKTPLHANPAPGGHLPFYYVMVVWGGHYLDMFLELALPSFLAPGNLPAMSNRAESRFLIFTTPEGRARIAAAPVFRRLQEVIEPVFVDSPWLNDKMPYHLKAAQGHRHGAEIAAAGEGYCIYLCPDCLISAGSFVHLEHLARAGKQAVMVSGLRLVTETVYRELRERDLLSPGQPIVLSGRELVALGMRHLHPEAQRYRWEHPYFSEHPVVCLWSVPGESGCLVRAFHLHPIMVSMKAAQDFSVLENSTVDGEFLGRNIVDWDNIYIETDSDHFTLFSLTSEKDRIWRLIPSRADMKKMGDMAYAAMVDHLHRNYFSKAIKLHIDDLNDSWAKVEEETWRLVYPVLNAPAAMRLPLVDAPLAVVMGELRKRIKRRTRRSVKKLFSLIRR